MLEVDLVQTHPIALQATLRCEAGELMAVVGPSGTGKSTLMKTIAGLLQGARGTVRVGDTAWLDSATGVNVPPHKRRVGFVFQSYALFPHLTVRDNVAAAADGNREERNAAALAALASVHMSGLEGRRPAQLSGGQQQRVGVARALVRRPQVLLLDEPFSAVDQMTRERLYEELAELRTQLAIPTVLVTHSIPEAQMLADSMVVLHRGRTLQAGRPEDVYRQPLDVDVARLMGHKNVFAATVRRDHSGAYLDWMGLQLRTDSREANGAEVAFCVAADDVLLTDEGSIPQVNILEARIEKALPVGPTITLHARLVNGESLVLTAPKHVLVKRAVAVGESVRLKLAPRAVHVMPARASSTSPKMLSD